THICPRDKAFWGGMMRNVVRSEAKAGAQQAHSCESGRLRWSRLNCIADWAALGRAAHYCTAQLARFCRCSERQLERFFKERSGRTPEQWLLALRLEDSLKALREGKMVKEVALDL